MCVFVHRALSDRAQPPPLWTLIPNKVSLSLARARFLSLSLSALNTQHRWASSVGACFLAHRSHLCWSMHCDSSHRLPLPHLPEMLSPSTRIWLFVSGVFCPRLPGKFKFTWGEEGTCRVHTGLAHALHARTCMRTRQERRTLTLTHAHMHTRRVLRMRKFFPTIFVPTIFSCFIFRTRRVLRMGNFSRTLSKSIFISRKSSTAPCIRARSSAEDLLWTELVTSVVFSHADNRH